MMAALRLMLLLLGAIILALASSEMIYRLRSSGDSLERAAQTEVVQAAAIEREFYLLQSQFGDGAVFTRAMKASHLQEESLQEELAKNLRERIWIEKQIGPSLAMTETEAREFYGTHRGLFAQPARYRARHIFLAAPDGSPTEVIAAKQSAVQGLAVRLLAGEKFEHLAAEASEDEATKARGGDLGYFSSVRVPPEFMAEVEKLQVGELSAPLRSHLGFHLVQVTEVKPGRELSFEDVRAEIQLSLGNAKRAAGVASLEARWRER